MFFENHDRESGQHFAQMECSAPSDNSASDNRNVRSHCYELSRYSAAVNVAVVGAGLAGLRAATLLKNKGHFVTVFEGRDRPGGRIHTAAGGFEEGAEWIDEDHNRMRALLSSLGIREVAAPAGQYLYSYNGEKRLEDAVWEEAAADALMFEKSLETVRPDSLGTIGDQVAAVCHSASGKWLVAANIRTDEGDEPSRLGLRQWLAYRSKYAQRKGGEGSAYRIEGGGSAFIGKLIDAVGIEPIYGHKLLAVRQNSGVTLEFRSGSVHFDAAVLALPLPCLLAIDCEPELQMRQALLSLGFPPMVKARFIFADDFWHQDGWFGYLKTDLLIQQAWPDRENPRALVSYICGDDARTIHEEEPADADLPANWKSISNEATVKSVEIKKWGADEFARGGFTTAPPGSDPAVARRRQSGKVQLCGEFCATWMGFMEGALESAEEAVAALC
jgi:monoamine oxidase